MIKTKQYDFDAIVVGSGISGSWAAKELTEQGLKVLVLERGKPLEVVAATLVNTRPIGSYPIKASRQGSCTKRITRFRVKSGILLTNQADNSGTTIKRTPTRWTRVSRFSGRGQT